MMKKNKCNLKGDMFVLLFRPFVWRVHNWAHQNASLVRRRFSTLCLSSILRICSIIMNSKSDNRCFSLLKWTGISQVIFFAETEVWFKQRLLRIKIVPGRSHKKFLKNRSGNDKNLKGCYKPIDNNNLRIHSRYFTVSFWLQSHGLFSITSWRLLYLEQVSSIDSIVCCLQNPWINLLSRRGSLAFSEFLNKLDVRNARILKTYRSMDVICFYVSIRKKKNFLYPDSELRNRLMFWRGCKLVFWMKMKTIIEFGLRMIFVWKVGWVWLSGWT